LIAPVPLTSAEAALAGDAGMKKFELDDDAVGFAKENGCFG
jgi:hypothetical protein